MSDERRPVKGWISDLITNAIVGALGALLLNFVASRLVPEFWGPSADRWGIAAVGAVGGVAAMLHTRFRGRARTSERAN
jgi:hypothetical protein